jgi:plasmid segregation protein ParM
MVNMNTKKTSYPEPIFGFNGEDYTIVAVDNGYADQKIAYWAKDQNGNKFIAEILLPSRAQMGAINISMDGKSSGVYEVNGDPWTVGKDVSEPESIRGQRYAYSELNTVLVNHSLIAAGFAGKKVKLGTGLPFDHFYKNGEPDTDFINRVKQSLKTPVKPKSNVEPARIEAHGVFPESTVTFVDYAIDDLTGEMKREFETGVAVVDIGGNTTDITCINSDFTVNQDRSGSRNLGVLNVRDRLLRLIKDDFKVDELRDSQLDSALRTGVCKIFGQECDVKKQIDSAKRESVKKLMNFVEEILGDAGDLDLVLFVGGGAEVLQDVIREYPHAIVPNRPQFANARGILKQITHVLEGQI